MNDEINIFKKTKLKIMKTNEILELLYMKGKRFNRLLKKYNFLIKLYAEKQTQCENLEQANKTLTLSYSILMNNLVNKVNHENTSINVNPLPMNVHWPENDVNTNNLLQSMLEKISSLSVTNKSKDNEINHTCSCNKLINVNCDKLISNLLNHSKYSKEFSRSGSFKIFNPYSTTNESIEPEPDILPKQNFKLKRKTLKHNVLMKKMLKRKVKRKIVIESSSEESIDEGSGKFVKLKVTSNAKKRKNNTNNLRDQMKKKVYLDHTSSTESLNMHNDVNGESCVNYALEESPEKSTAQRTNLTNLSTEEDLITVDIQNRSEDQDIIPNKETFENKIEENNHTVFKKPLKYLRPEKIENKDSNLDINNENNGTSQKTPEKIKKTFKADSTENPVEVLENLKQKTYFANIDNQRHSSSSKESPERLTKKFKSMLDPEFLQNQLENLDPNNILSSKKSPVKLIKDLKSVIQLKSHDNHIGISEQNNTENCLTVETNIGNVVPINKLLETDKNDNINTDLSMKPPTVETSINNLIDLDATDSDSEESSFNYEDDKSKAKLSQCENRGDVYSLIYNLIDHEWDTDIFNTSMDSLVHNSPKLIAKILINEVMDEVDPELNKEFTPPAPILSGTLQKIIILIKQLDLKANYNLEGTILEICRKKLLSEASVKDIDPLTRLFVSLCKLKYDIKTVRLLCCDAAFYLGKLYVPFMFATITLWPEVLPAASKVEVEDLANVLTFVILLNRSRENEGSNYLLLLDILKKQYGYYHKQQISSILFKEILDVYVEKKSNIIYSSLIILFKNIYEKTDVLKFLENEKYRSIIFNLSNILKGGSVMPWNVVEKKVNDTK